jgi:hypothetical protein
MSRSPKYLIFAGVIGLLFFWLSDPRYGVAAVAIHDDHLRDAANQGLPGTIVGLVGSAVVLLIGAWLSIRRAV